MFLSRFQSDSNFPRIHQSQGPPFLWEHKIQTCSAVFNKGNSEGELGAWDIVGPAVLLNTPYVHCFPCAGLKCYNFIIYVSHGNSREFNLGLSGFRLCLHLPLAWIKLPNEWLAPGCQGKSHGQPRSTQLVFLEKWGVEMGCLLVGDRAETSYWIYIVHLH